MKKIVLIQSPSKYYGAVPIFYKEASKLGLFDKFYFATDDSSAEKLGDDCHIIKLKKDYQFGGNMLRALEYVEEELFIVCCEDHIMKKDNNIAVFDTCFDFFDTHKDAGYLRLTYHDKVQIKHKEKFISSLKKKYKYYISLQPSVWRKEYFYSTLKDREDAWAYEIKGAARARGNNKYRSYGVNERVFYNTNFYQKGKYYRRQYIDYALSNGLEVPKQFPVLYKGEILSVDQYIEKKGK